MSAFHYNWAEIEAVISIIQLRLDQGTIYIIEKNWVVPPCPQDTFDGLFCPGAMVKSFFITVAVIERWFIETQNDLLFRGQLKNN